MNRCCFSVTVGVGLIFLANAVSAQSPTAKPTAPLDIATSRDKAEADRIAKERRAQARSLLISLTSDARSFRDLKLRARWRELPTPCGAWMPSKRAHTSAKPGKPLRQPMSTRRLISWAMDPLTFAEKS